MLNQMLADFITKSLTVKFVCLVALILTPLISSAQTPAPKPCFDFTGTGRTSFVTTTGNGTTGSNIVWNILSNGGDGSAQVYAFGRGGIESRDGLVPGYYDDDNRADAAVTRWSGFQSGLTTFYVRPSTQTAANSNAYYGAQWGAFPDNTAPGDYDGDGRTDLTVVRRESGRLFWYILRSQTNTISVIDFGFDLDIVVRGADYNGDGRDEITVIRLNTGTANTYYAGDSNTGALVLAQNWGTGNSSNGDVYVIGDYIGDRRADFAVMRRTGFSTTAPNATWWILENGGTGQVVVRQFGYAATLPDLAVCGDYNGDGKQDIAVYRQSDRTFYWLNSPAFDTFSSQQWGQVNNLNLPIGILYTWNN